MSQSFAFHFDPDDKVIDIVYLSLLNDLLRQEGHPLRGYSGPARDLTNDRKRATPKDIFQTFNESLRDAPAGLGLRYGMALNLVAANTFGQLVMSCSNVRQAYHALREYQLLLGISTELQMDVQGDCASIEVGALYSERLPDYLQHFATETLYTTIQNQVRWLTGIPVRYRRLHLPYAEPGHVDQYVAMFGCELAFSAASHRIEFDASYLELPIITANEQIKLIKSRRCSDTLRRIESRLNIESKIRSILLQTCPDFPHLDDIAARLHMSRSCLYRKLRSHHTSYQSLINNFKQDQAISLLKHTSLTIPEIAETIGFSDASSFRRAFKSWTGYQPSTLRT